ncbi:uncharacterized protein LOC144451942 [Glandiceps talaboti]
MADSGGGAKPTETGAIYHEVSTKQLFAVKVYGGLTAVMVVIAMIFCLARGAEHTRLYLLLVNLIISSIVGLAVAWWYKKEDLSTDKIWFLALVASVIVFQCITTDIYVWNHHSPNSVTPTPTPTMRIITIGTPNATNISTTKSQHDTLQKIQPTVPSKIAQNPTPLKERKKTVANPTRPTKSGG